MGKGRVREGRGGEERRGKGWHTVSRCRNFAFQKLAATGISIAQSTSITFKLYVGININIYMYIN